MKKSEEKLELHFRPRATETVSIEIPQDSLYSLKEVASKRDMSYKALLKFYIGQGLRQDLAKIFAERVLDATAKVLSRHIQSEEEVSAIIQEIQKANTQVGSEQKV